MLTPWGVSDNQHRSDAIVRHAQADQRKNHPDRVTSIDQQSPANNVWVKQLDDQIWQSA